MMNKRFSYKYRGEFDFSEVSFVDFEELLKSRQPAEVADILLEKSTEEHDFIRKNILDRFLDFVYYKVQNGNLYVPNLAYPTKRMMDSELEKKVIEIMNNNLFPEIILYILKFFTRNINNPDTNLYLANLITSDQIIKSVYETYRLVKGDIMMSDPGKRSLNVKRLQQFSMHSDDRLSSPLDTAARLKYILEFFLIKYDVSHLFTREMILLSGD